VPSAEPFQFAGKGAVTALILTKAIASALATVIQTLPGTGKPFIVFADIQFGGQLILMQIAFAEYLLGKCPGSIQGRHEDGKQ